MKMDPYQGGLPKILHLFLLIFQGKFQISCVVRNNYVKDEIGLSFTHNLSQFFTGGRQITVSSEYHQD